MAENRQYDHEYKVQAVKLAKDLIKACWINSAWLILQRVTRSENSAYSSSVKRVLITRRRWGVLYLFMAVNLLSWVDFFKRRKPQKGGLGVATPTRFP